MSSREDELIDLAARLLQHAGLPLLQRHPRMQMDLKTAADVVKEHAAVLRAYEGDREE
jgi:hypothetical protein